MKIIGYGICGPGEATRYMRETLDEFKRLCDEVVILCNNTSKAEHDLIDSYGFKRVSDRREWGTLQWRIKQDFIERDIKQMANEGDMLVCLDMDETIPKLTREWLQQAELDAYHVFVVDLWNDEQHFKLESCFWNVRIWRWNGETAFKAKPVHCGLAPQWTYHYHRHAPFCLLHKGLMLRDDRQAKLKRYEKYDPHAQHLDRRYYDMLKSDHARPLDFDVLSKQIEEEVATYQQKKPSTTIMAKQKKPRFGYVRNQHGVTLDIPEKDVARTLKRPGFQWVGWVEDEQEEIEQMFEDDELLATPSYSPHQDGSYHRSAVDEARELNELNSADDLLNADAPIVDDTDLFDVEDAQILGKTDPPASLAGIPVHITDTPPADEHPKPNPNKKPEAKVDATQPAPKTRKSSAKKTARKK